MIFINFKAYQQGSGANALKLVKVLESASQGYDTKVVVAVGATDIREVAQSTQLEVWAQAIDHEEYGAHTGSVIAEAVLEDGAKGTFLNHSENKLSDFEQLRKANLRAQQLGLQTLVFASSIEEFQSVLGLHPNLIAYEPPELIGSTTVSVVGAKPEVISQVAVLANEAGVPLIVGAGVHSREDVKKSLELGAVGVALATDVVKAQDPPGELKDLLEGFK